MFLHNMAEKEQIFKKMMLMFSRWWGRSKNASAKERKNMNLLKTAQMYIGRWMGKEDVYR